MWTFSRRRHRRTGRCSSGSGPIFDHHVADDRDRPARRVEIVLAVHLNHRQLLAEQADTTVDADVLVWKLTRSAGTEIAQRVRLSANKAARWLERTLHRPPNDIAFDESITFAEHIVEDGLTVS